MKHRAVLLFGPPGSGKGTLGKALAEKGGFVHISSGDIFRGLKPDSKGGRAFAEYASKGLHVPDEVTVQIFEEHVQSLVEEGLYHPDKQRLLLDGIPRTKHQAEVLDRDVDVESIILIEISDVEILVSRLKKRAEIEGRADDQEEAILRERFAVFERQTKEVLSHYPADKVFHLNGEGSKESVLDDLSRNYLN